MKGSKKRREARKDLQRLYEKIHNQRKDYFFKLAHELTDRFDKIIMEDLNLKGMKKLWGRKVSDLAYGEFRLILQWIAQKKGMVFVKADRWFPSTKLCRVCKTINKEITLKNRVFSCKPCGHVEDRDIHAAKYLEEYPGNWAGVTSSVGGVPVRPNMARQGALIPESLWL